MKRIRTTIARHIYICTIPEYISVSVYQCISISVYQGFRVSGFQGISVSVYQLVDFELKDKDVDGLL